MPTCDFCGKFHNTASPAWVCNCAPSTADRKRRTEEAHHALHGHRKCPNCHSAYVHEHPVNECILNVLVLTLRDRGNLEPEVLEHIHASCDADALWGDLGPIADKLESGAYGGAERVPPEFRV